MDHMGCMVGVRWGKGSQIYGPHGVSSQHDGGRKSQGVTGSCGGMVPIRAVGHVQPWGHAHTGFCVHLGLRLTWGYGSGPHLWATGTPSPLSGRNETPPTPLSPSHLFFFTSNCSPPPPIAPHTPASLLQLTSCLLLNSILLLQPVFLHPLMSLYPPNTPPESPIAPQGPSQTQHISPTDKLGHHRLLQSPAAAHIPL